MKSLDYFLLEMEDGEILDQTIQGKSIKFHIDPMYNPTEHARISGKLYCHCVKMPHVPVGAKVYYNYNWSDEENTVKMDGKTLLRTMAHEAFCYVIDDEIHMLNGYIFCRARST